MHHYLWLAQRDHRLSSTPTWLVQDILDTWETAYGSFTKVFPHEYRRALEQMKAEKEQEELLAAHGEGDALAVLKAATEAAAKDNAPEHSYLDYLPPAPQVLNSPCSLSCRFRCGFWRFSAHWLWALWRWRRRVCAGQGCGLHEASEGC